MSRNSRQRPGDNETGEPSGDAPVRTQRRQRPVGALSSNVDKDERKRVLNVLAQRRYRKRKKERQAQLERLAGGSVHEIDDDHDETTGSSGSRSGSAEGSSIRGHSISNLSPADMALDDWPVGLLDDASAPSQPLPFQGQSSPTDLVINPASLSTSITSPILNFADLSIPNDPFNLQFFPDPFFGNLTAHPNPSLSASSPDSSSSSSLLPSSNHSNDNPTIRQNPQDQLSAFLQEDDITHTTFADDHLLHVSELDLLRAAATIGRRIHSLDRIWDLSATSIFVSPSSTSNSTSPFTSPTNTAPATSLSAAGNRHRSLPPVSSWTLSLPANLQPTRLQRSVPHAPLIDVLPWPRVRDKLIAMYSQPEDVWPRHPAATTTTTAGSGGNDEGGGGGNNGNRNGGGSGEPCALIRLVYDMEAGGVVVQGSEPSAEEGWVVVEQGFVDAWWWALDWGCLERGNRWRRERGLGDLVVGGGRRR